jgi:hypothetical protein
MSEDRIDKLQIARRELDFAILAPKRGEESLAVHLLAFSAFRILFDLTKRRHGDGALVFMLDRFLDRREKLGREFHDIPNSMKHADKEPDGWLEQHTPKSAYLTLALTIILWTALGEIETAMMAEFWTLDSPLLPDHKAAGGLEYLLGRAGEFHVEPGPRTLSEIGRILNLTSS